MLVFGYDRQNADQTLQRLKRAIAGFIDNVPSPRLAAWSKSAAQTTDAYWVQMAQKMVCNLLRLIAASKGAQSSESAHSYQRGVGGGGGSSTHEWAQINC